MSKAKRINRCKTVTRKEQPKLTLLQDYFKETFKKIENANSNFCRTMGGKLNDRIASSIRLRAQEFKQLKPGCSAELASNDFQGPMENKE